MAIRGVLSRSEIAKECGFAKSALSQNPLRLGDSVLCTRNMWTIGLQNGSVGKIVEVEDVAKPASTAVEADQPPVLAWIEWDNGQRRPLTRDMLEDIQLGYAVTVHKAQGSQWQRVIVPVTGSRLLDRTLLYTAVTRAQRQVVLVGDVDAASTAVLAQPRAAERNIGLDLTVKTLLGMPMTHSDNQNEPPRVSRRLVGLSGHLCQGVAVGKLPPVVCLSFCRRDTPDRREQSDVVEPVHPL